MTQLIRTTLNLEQYKIILTVWPEAFEFSMGRKPRSQDEFDEWARLAEKGPLNGHIDWDILYKCTCDAMPDDGGDGPAFDVRMLSRYTVC